MPSKNKKVISVSKETMDKLAKLGKFGDTYEDIILRLLNENSSPLLPTLQLLLLRHN